MKPTIHMLLALVVCAGVLRVAGAQTERPVTVGSKAFEESWILGEALTTLAKEAGVEAKHASNLGGTDVVYAALKRGDVDLYPEYTGTIAEAILKSKARPSLDDMRAAVQKDGLGISNSLGFNNSYALGVKREKAEKLGLRRISDLARHPELRIALTHELLERKDGWPGLTAHYGLRMANVNGIQHALAYEAVKTGQADVIDIYTTDAQIQRLGLTLLEDDRAFFPRYNCVLLYRLDLPQRAPKAFESMSRLIGKIDEAAMIRANALVTLDGQTQQQAAAALLGSVLPSEAPRAVAAPAPGLVDHLLKHLQLVGLSLLAAAAIGIPLGIAASRSQLMATITLSTTGVLQTIPSLALLAFLIPILGIYEPPAYVALFLYSLLPIVRNTFTGLTTLPINLSEAAEALGLSPSAQLLRVRLPMASPAIMAGLKTSAVINVGTATLAGLVGAGGLGDPIWRGLQTNNHSLILQGAIPAALLALVVQGAFDLLERVVVPRGLRLKPGEG
jgi:osmoprotectant transport system permease protein